MEDKQIAMEIVNKLIENKFLAEVPKVCDAYKQILATIKQG